MSTAGTGPATAAGHGIASATRRHGHRHRRRACRWRLRRVARHGAGHTCDRGTGHHPVGCGDRQPPVAGTLQPERAELPRGDVVRHLGPRGRCRPRRSDAHSRRSAGTARAFRRSRGQGTRGVGGRRRAGAARSLEAARAIDPASPAVVELSSRLSEVARERDAAARGTSARQLPAPPPAPTDSRPQRPPAREPAPAAIGRRSCSAPDSTPRFLRRRCRHRPRRHRRRRPHPRCPCRSQRSPPRLRNRAEPAIAARRRRDLQSQRPQRPHATKPTRRRFAASWRRMDAPSRPRTWRSSDRSSRTCPPTRSAGSSRGSAR